PKQNIQQSNNNNVNPQNNQYQRAQQQEAKGEEGEKKMDGFFSKLVNDDKKPDTPPAPSENERADNKNKNSGKHHISLE
ncbi:MAG: hypothetical protein ACQESF_05700, partial [Nanobdellota archaeon]